MAAMAPLFLVSMATVGYEIALTRYFAVAKWSEYGYWVISIVLAGFALSGVVMALGRDWFCRHGGALLAGLPAALIAAAAIGYHFVTIDPFNPLQLQNQASFAPQLWNIAGYYACLLPFFFLSGLFVSLNFVLNDSSIGRVYGFDLTGAGIGSLLVLGLMWLVHPFALVPCLLVPIALAAFVAPRRGLGMRAITLLMLLGGGGLLVLDDEAAVNDYKAIYAPLHVPDSRVLAELRTPRGLYTLLDDFTERVDTDISNNAALMGLPGPGHAFGLYRDGNRLAALPKPGDVGAGYAKATLAALPYLLHPHPTLLLIGASGGFRIAEAQALGATRIDALEPEPVLRAALTQGLGGSPAYPAAPGLRIGTDSPIAAARADGPFDIVDLSGDFLDSAEANTSAFAAEALATYLRSLSPGGIVSIPVSIREFPAYAIRMLATARLGLAEAGIADAASHVMVVRSAWNVRILLSNAPFEAGRIAAAKAFADDRSFDMSYYPGIDVVAARANIYNDLPDVSFEQGEVTSDGAGAHDAIADEAGAVLAGQSSESARAFDLSPMTYDRPAFYSVLRLTELGTILKRLEILPQAEIGALVNLAVLAQAIVVAAIVLAVPLLGGRRMRVPGGGTLRAIVYFSALGLGFLFLELFLIDRASFYLNDRTSGFALVLTGMLIFSGVGSLFEHRFEASPGRGMIVVVAIVLAWCLLLRLFLQPMMLASLDWAWPVRAVLVVATVAPVSVALGLPFPLGLSRVGSGSFLPWAWGLNGAFSVVSTPLANLVAQQFGYDRVLLVAMLLYVTSLIAFPVARKNPSWPKPTPA